jgi:hypothetical protein
MASNRCGLPPAPQVDAYAGKTVPAISDSSPAHPIVVRLIHRSAWYSRTCRRQRSCATETSSAASTPRRVTARRLLNPQLATCVAFAVSVSIRARMAASRAVLRPSIRSDHRGSTSSATTSRPDATISGIGSLDSDIVATVRWRSPGDESWSLESNGLCSPATSAARS